MSRLTWLAMASISCMLGACTSQSIIENKPARIVDVKIEKELTLGERSDGKGALFQSVRSFRVDHKGHIYVLDSRAPRLLKFNGTGELLFSIGQKGQGPGEFMVPIGMELGKNGSVLIYDIGNRRLAYFSADTGELIEEISTAKQPRMFRIDDDSQGNFYCYQVLPGPEKTVRLISKYSPTFEFIKEIIRVEEKPLGNEIQVIPTSLLFRILADDGLLVAKSDEYKFYRYNSTGGIAKTVSNDYKRVNVTAADKEREIKIRFEGAPAPKDQVFVFPDYYPPIEYLITDDEDNIFVRQYEVDKAGRHFYEAFNREGRSLGKFALGFTVNCIVGDRMYSLEDDDEGFNQICRYKFEIRMK